MAIHGCQGKQSLPYPKLWALQGAIRYFPLGPESSSVSNQSIDAINSEIISSRYCTSDVTMSLCVVCHLFNPQNSIVMLPSHLHISREKLGPCGEKDPFSKMTQLIGGECQTWKCLSVSVAITSCGKASRKCGTQPFLCCILWLVSKPLNFLGQHWLSPKYPQWLSLHPTQLEAYTISTQSMEGQGHEKVYPHSDSPTNG